MNDAQDQSHSSWRQLEDEWGNVCDRWNDNMTRYFETQFWSLLAGETRAYHRALDTLSETLHAARVVCNE